MAVRFIGEMMRPVDPGEPHLPCVIAVDTSESMSGGSIDELNDGLKAFVQALVEDSQAFGRIEVCVISFNSNVNVSVPFTPVEEFVAPRFEASGSTAMNEAIITALDIIEDRKADYKRRSIKYYRPWFFLMTNAHATDLEKQSQAIYKLTDSISRRQVSFFPMAIGENADIAILKTYANNNDICLLYTSYIRIVLQHEAVRIFSRKIHGNTSFGIESERNPIHALSGNRS